MSTNTQAFATTAKPPADPVTFTVRMEFDASGKPATAAYSGYPTPDAEKSMRRTSADTAFEWGV